MLAYLTTCIGLVNACSSFSRKLYPKIAYRHYVLIFTLAGAIFSNLGLERILAVAVPILVFLYPISIALVTLSILHPFIRYRQWTYVFGVLTATFFALNDLLFSLSIHLPWQSVIEKLPMAGLGLGWIVLSIIMAVISFILSPKKAIL